MLNFSVSGLQVLRSSVFALSMLLLSGAAMADRPEWAGSRDDDGEDAHQYKHHKDRHREDDDRDDDERHERHVDRDAYESPRGGSIEIQIGGYFGDTMREETHEYYRERLHSGHCPPGLAKKRNGCMPPGHDRRWTVGESLPQDVVYYPVEPEIKVKLGIPPAGHKFVRVASDILLIAVGSGLVVDAIQDIGK